MIDLRKCQANYSKAQLRMGQRVEMEHTRSPGVALKIAKQHLCEHPEYYTYLKKMERKLRI